MIFEFFVFKVREEKMPFVGNFQHSCVFYLFKFEFNEDLHRKAHFRTISNQFIKFFVFAMREKCEGTGLTFATFLNFESSNPSTTNTLNFDL